MGSFREYGKPLTRLLGRLLSIPIFLKILGIGALVATVFGTVTLLQIRGSISRGLQEMLEQRTRSLAGSLVAGLERPLSIGDTFSVDQKLRRTMRMFSDIRYIVVWDPKGRVASHTFNEAVPRDIVRLFQQRADMGETFRVFASQQGLVFDVTAPILDGHAGVLQLGVTDRLIIRELTSVQRSVLWGLALCASIGAGLALLLTHILTRPLHHLMHAANRIRRGDFETRSEIFSADEIGRLADAFNQMTESLYKYRQEVQEKERVRLSLIEKIVHAQEEERKIISRELHDQLGQSLLALLLLVQSLDKELAEDGQKPETLCRDLENQIRQLIDEVRRLAWGMRPSILDDYGLDFALARHVEETAEHFGLPIDYQYICPPGLGRLPGQIEVTLYRIAQEALMNVVIHAQAGRASAVVLQRREEVTLVVEDDGRGFDPAVVLKNGDGCLGLTGMRERAALLDGTCAVESTPQHGTTIRVQIRLNGDKPCQSVS